MALVAAEPPSCSLIPTCSLLRAPLVTYYCAPCFGGDLLLVFLCLCLFMVMSRWILVKGPLAAILRSYSDQVFSWDTLGTYLVCVWIERHIFLSKSPSEEEKR